MVRQREVHELLLNYRDTVRKLKDLGIIKTSNVVSGYGEYVAKKKLGLTLQGTVNKGFDGIDKNGTKYEIKSRKATSWSEPTRFMIKKERLKYFDYLVYTEFDDDWNLIHFLIIPRNNVKPNEHNVVIINDSLIEKYDKLGSVNKKRK